MRARVWRWLRRAVIALNVAAALLLIAIGAAAWLLASEGGTAWLVRAAAGRAAPDLTIGAIRGTLLDELRLQRLEYRSADTEVEIAEVTASLTLVELVRGALVIEDLRVSPVSYRSTATARAEAEAGPPPSTPLAVIVRNGVVDSISITTPDNALIFGRLELAGRFVGNELSLERFATSTSGFEASGRVTLTLADAIGIDGELSWGRTVGGDRYLGTLVVAGRLPELNIEHELAAPFTVTTSGLVVLEERPRVDLEFAWRNVTLADYGFASPSGTAEVSGPIDALAFAASGAVEAVESSVEFDGNGMLDGALVTFERLRVTGREGDVTLSGEIALDTLEWRATVAAEALDPGVRVPTWPGRIRAAGDFAGRLGPDLEIATGNLRLDGTLRDRPFEARFSGRLDAGGRARIDELAVTSGRDRVEIRGDVADELDLAVAAEIGALEPYRAGLTGSASADLSLTGAIAAPVVGGTVELLDAAYDGVSVGHATLRGSAVAAADGRLDLELVGEALAAGALDVERMRAAASGRLTEHTATLELVGDDWTASAAAAGALAARRWRGAVDALELRQAVVGAWTLRAPASLTLGPGEVALARSCVEQGASSVCAEAQLVGAADDGIRVSAVDFDVRTLDPLLPETFDIEGIYQLDADFAGLGAEPAGTLRVTGGTTRVRMALEGAEPVALELTEVSVGAELEAWSLAVNLDLTGRESGRFSVALAAEDLRTRQSSLRGNIEAFWPDLGALSLLSPDLGTVTGTLGVDIEIGGTRAEPEVMGEARWNAGSVEVPEWGVRIESIEARAASADARSLDFMGSGAIDGRELSLSGRTELDPDRGWPTQLELHGRELPIVQLADAEIYVTPDLKVDVVLPLITVEGTVHVPRATIALEELPSQAVRPSADTVVHAEGVEAPARPLHTRADLRITLGDDVHYFGSNLTTDVSGEMRLQYDSYASTNAVGTLDATGTYDAYGQSLDLERGELLFSGPLDDPALDFRAVRRVGEQTVGVELAGTLRAPSTMIFSEPRLSEADALSYLMFGRPLSGTGEQEAATLESAALAMGLQQALPAVQRIGETLGLDELSIEPTEADAGALMAGKYLSPKLYIRYTYGLFNRIGGLLLRYKVNDRLSIETRSGNEKSMDLLYTVEKE